MQLRVPAPLVPGSRIGVTAPSSGVPDALRPRLDAAVDWLERRGYEVRLGECLDGSGHVSAPAEQRAAELMDMLLDPGVDAIVPPWGGETGIDLLPLLDFEALRRARPCWVVGFSDLSTILVPLTLVSGWATLHGSNLMDTPYAVPDGLQHWTAVAGLPAGGTVRQMPPGVHRAHDFDDWAADPTASSHRWNGTGRWRRLDESTAPVDVAGRVIGGCIETVANLAGTAYGDTATLGDGPRIVYVEAAEDAAFSICRQLHGMRLAGFFDGAAAVLIGRTTAPDSPGFTQDDAVVDALGALGIPLIADVDCGHVPPQMPIVNGALGRVVVDGAQQRFEQVLA